MTSIKFAFILLLCLLIKVDTKKAKNPKEVTAKNILHEVAIEDFAALHTHFGKPKKTSNQGIVKLALELLEVDGKAAADSHEHNEHVHTPTMTEELLQSLRNWIQFLPLALDQEKLKKDNQLCNLAVRPMVESHAGILEMIELLNAKSGNNPEKSPQIKWLNRDQTKFIESQAARCKALYVGNPFMRYFYGIFETEKELLTGKQAKFHEENINERVRKEITDVENRAEVEKNE